MSMSIGTKSILYGAHCWFIHPWFVALAWWKLYGVPLDPRLWVVFFLHDIGYLGKPNMDGFEGERHVLLGAEICSRLFDWSYRPFNSQGRDDGPSWWSLCLLHSRYWAKQRHLSPRRLCYADKLAFVITPSWIYLPLVWLTGEWREYATAHNHEVHHSAEGQTPTLRQWYYPSREYVRQWVEQHKDGSADTWTRSKPTSEVL